MSDPFIGQITLYPYGFAPQGWADCQGQLLPIQQNAALFSLLGTSFGGDGVQTFALPDLRGRAAIGMGNIPGGSTYVMGEMGGEETVTVTHDSMPNHSHALNALTDNGTMNLPAAAVLATVFQGNLDGGNSGNVYNPGTADVQLVQNSLQAAAGPGGPHNNVQPFLTLRYCIALRGVFPPRG